MGRGDDAPSLLPQGTQYRSDLHLAPIGHAADPYRATQANVNTAVTYMMFNSQGWLVLMLGILSAIVTGGAAVSAISSRTTTHPSILITGLSMMMGIPGKFVYIK
jgi:hypothetical protein